MWIYTSQALHIYGTTDTTSEAYNTGANQVGEMFANYNLIAALAAFLLPLAKYTSRKFTHFIALVCGGLGSYIHLFHTRTNSLHYEWLDWCWNLLGQYPFCSYAMLSGSSNKMGYTWSF
jgi:maltose/moltooligosaccharide transporter